MQLENPLLHDWKTDLSTEWVYEPFPEDVGDHLVNEEIEETGLASDVCDDNENDDDND